MEIRKQVIVKTPLIPDLRFPDILASGKWADPLVDSADPALREAGRMHQHAYQGWQALDSARKKRNPNDHPGKHFQNIEALSQKLIKSLSTRYDSAKLSIKQRQQQLDAEIKERVTSGISADAQEIRTALREMKPDERSKVVQAAIREGDRNVMSAIFNGNPVTCGFESQELAALRRMAENLHAKELQQAKEQLEKAETIVTNAFTASLEVAQTVAPKELLEQYTKEAAAADEALMGFARQLES